MIAKVLATSAGVIVVPSLNLTPVLTVICRVVPPVPNWYPVAIQGCIPEGAGLRASIS